MAIGIRLILKKYLLPLLETISVSAGSYGFLNQTVSHILSRRRHDKRFHHTTYNLRTVKRSCCLNLCASMKGFDPMR
jgi:hypothetical protein